MPLLRLVERHLTTALRSIAFAMEYLGPMVEVRIAQADQYGSDWPDRPVCSVFWSQCS
jgi:hypothetical protein